MLKKIIFVGLLFFLHVPMGAMEESEELDRAFLEAMQRNAAHASTAGMKEVDEAKLYEGTIDLAAYLQGAAKGVVKGVVELSEVVKHPIDNFFIPVGMFVNDARIIGACGDLGLNYDPEDCVYNYDKERELMGISNYDDAKLRMEERALVLVKSIEHFVAAPGPEKLEILTSMAVTSMVPGTVARGVTKVAVNKYKFGVYANPNKFNNLHPDDLNPRPSISYEEFRNLAGKTEHKWAITTDGKLHLSHPHQEGSLLEIKHPDIVNGKPVIAAGMVHAYFGKLGGKSKNGDFFSGHFRTYGDELKQIVPYIFKKHGFDDFKLKPEPFPAVKEALTHAIPGESILKIEPTPLLAILAASRKTTEPQLELQAQAENPPMQQLNPNLPSQSIINNNNVPNSQGAEAPAITPQSGEARALALLARAKAIQQEREQTRVQAENKARLEIEERMRDLDRVRNQAADRFWDSDEYIRPINAAEEAVKKALDHAALLGKQRMKTVEEFDDLAFACEEAQRAALEVAETYARLLDSDLIVGSDFAKIVAYARENVIAFGKMQGKSQEVAKWQKHVQDFQLKEVGVKKLIAQGEQKKAQASACAANLEKKAREADAGAQRLIKAKANVQLAIEAFVRSAGGIVSASQAAQANQNHTQLQSQLTAAIQELADAGAFDEAVQEQRDAYARAEAARQAAVQEIARQAQVEVLRKELVAASLDNLRIVNWYNTKKKQKAKDLAAVEANRARWHALHATWVATPEGALDKMGPWEIAAGVYEQEQAQARDAKKAKMEEYAQLAAQNHAHIRAQMHASMDQFRAQQQQQQSEMQQRNREDQSRREEQRQQQIQSSAAAVQKRQDDSRAQIAARYENQKKHAAAEKTRKAAIEEQDKKAKMERDTRQKKEEQAQVDRKKKAQAAQAVQPSSSSNRGAGYSSGSGGAGSGSSNNGQGKSSVKWSMVQADNSAGHVFIDCDTGRYLTGGLNKDGSPERRSASSSELGRSACDGGGSLGGGSNGGGAQ